tara:strand:- start:1553 stop:1657 length:105 start_codon:yes stop_codon:yes gene_type:complete
VAGMSIARQINFLIELTKFVLENFNLEVLLFIII